MKCPECGAGEEHLDWRWVGNGDIVHWNCFECEHEWDENQKENENA